MFLLVIGYGFLDLSIPPFFIVMISSPPTHLAHNAPSSPLMIDYDAYAPFTLPLRIQVHSTRLSHSDVLNGACMTSLRVGKGDLTHVSFYYLWTQKESTKLRDVRSTLVWTLVVAYTYKKRRLNRRQPTFISQSLFRNSAWNSSITSNVWFKCSNVTCSPLPRASEWAVLAAFLICRPLIFLFANVEICSGVIKEAAPILEMKAFQTCSLDSWVRSWKWSATWIRERKASSNALTRLVVRNRIPR